MKLFSLDTFFRQSKIFLTGWILLSLLLFAFFLYPTAVPSVNPADSTVSETASVQSETSAMAITQTSAESVPIDCTSSSIEQDETAVLTPAVSEESVSATFVYYNQKDALWSDSLYGEDSISGYGCGPTVCAMLISSLTEQTVTPADMAEWSVQNGCYIQGGGSYHTLIPLACKSYGLKVEGYTKNDREAILTALKAGAYVCVIMGPGDFTETGHFILLTGITENGKLTVADPASRANSEQLWDADLIFEQARSYAASGGPFWVVTAES